VSSFSLVVLGLRCCSYAGLLARMMLASLGFLGCFFLNEFTTFGFTRLVTFFWLLYPRLVILRLMVLDFYDLRL
jgi:hypothetical protein